VLDGVDGILLGAETYRGNYALETVKTGEQCAIEAGRRVEGLVWRQEGWLAVGSSLGGGCRMGWGEGSLWRLTTPGTV
jgi:hypothetical protein